MEEVLDRLYVGGDTDYERLKDKQGWSFLRCCKFGTGGHKDTLGYAGNAAPKGPTYLAVTKGNRMALNFIDAMDPNFIPVDMVKKGIRYVYERLEAGDKVLVACNQGHSRGPTTAMLFLRSVGELPGNFHRGEQVFHTLYHKYEPGEGVRTFARQQWSAFDNLLKGNNG